MKFSREFDDLKRKELRIDGERPHGGSLRVHLCYPNQYWVGMSNLGYQAVFGLFGREEEFSVERGFLPENGITHGEPLRTVENARPLADCDIIAASLSFETDYLNFLQMLDNAKILNPDSTARIAAADNTKFPPPLILVGGTSATLNPEPVADVVDVIALGEAEEVLPEFCVIVRQAKAENISRLELLKRLAMVEGLYVPHFHTVEYFPDGTVKKFSIKEQFGITPVPVRRFVKDLSAHPTHTRILTPETEFKSMFLTETGRGCEMGCRFCVAGYIYRPIRKRSEESIRATIDVGLQHSKAIGFVGAAVSSHRSIAKLAAEVAERGARASLSSLMSQKVNKMLAASITESEYKTVALAPEAGSERLRRAAGKRVANEQVLKAAMELSQNGIQGFKLYFIVGLPTETEEDIDAIADLAKVIRDGVTEMAKGSGRNPWVQLSVNPFIPKASTPFQWEPMLDLEVLEQKITRIKELIKKEHNMELRYEPPKESYFQALLSRGDRKVVQYLLAAVKTRKDWKWILKNGERYLQEECAPELRPLPIAHYTERRIPFGEKLPWEIQNSLIEKGLLFRENRRAYLGEEFTAPEEKPYDEFRAEEPSEELIATAILG